MNRVQLIQDVVYSSYAKIYNSTIRIAAISHTSSVVNNATLFASFQKENVELSQVAALLHDYALFCDNCLPTKHAQLSADFAEKLLSSCSLFSEEEIQLVVSCIRVHSEKEIIHSSFCEILKDADLLAKYLEDPDQELKEHEKKRLKNAFERFHLF
ncbi:MAG: HD domain-containing protein [Bacillota bacterium]|nr:HD domain-containing protein [Bacillota bacterium]